jgi:hypothetical protein
MRRSLVVTGLLVAVGLIARPAAADLITNGNFQTGTLAGWTVFTTGSNGTNGAALPDVSPSIRLEAVQAMRRTSMWVK